MGNTLEEEIHSRVSNALVGISIECPDCEYMEDEQYTCTTCWCEGGNGRLNISKYINITI